MARKAPPMPKLVVQTGPNATKPRAARKPKAKTNGKGNTDALHAQIRAMVLDLHKVDGEIVDAVVKHVKPLRDRRRKLFRSFKADTGINREILDIKLKQYVLRLKTSEIEDEDHRAKVETDIHDVDLALHGGKQIDWIAELGVATK